MSNFIIFNAQKDMSDRRIIALNPLFIGVNQKVSGTEEFVGEENIILAQVHYDEDTPHLQAYFLPIVNEVKRKCYEKDEKGNVIKQEIENKNGNKTLVPKLMRDNNGNIVYETSKGKFLNNDQFWKLKGGKNSYAKMQNDFNKFITERGFKLDRGNIGANIEHQTKKEYQINELNAEIKELQLERDYNLKQVESTKESLEKAIKSVDKEILNPKKNVVGYNTKDVVKIIEYSKELEKIKTIQDGELNNKDNTILKLKTENDSFKNNKELIKRNKIIQEQKVQIKEQKTEIARLEDLVDVLTNNIETLKTKFKRELDKWKNLFDKVVKELDKVLGREPKEYLEDYEDLADAINYGYYDEKHKGKNKDKDDFEIAL